MAYENLCMYCFEDMKGQTTCPHCGRDSRAAVPQIQMLPGSRVYHDRFLIGRALGQDASGIVYAAFDTKKENKLRIREYLPRDCAERLNDGAVVPIAGMEDQFDAGLKKLRASVEGVEDPRRRHFFFEENGTAYIAQRKTAAPAAGDGTEEDEDTGNRRRVLLFAGIAVAVLLVAAILLITIFNGALNTGRDITQSPTLDPNQVWIPAATPTATPYVAPTFAALVDPELSWMEYTYDGDVEQEYQRAQRASATPTPAPAATRGSYRQVSGNSGSTEIRALQRRLMELGWLDGSGLTGEYDSATRQAVRDFQRYINEAYDPGQKLSVDGAAGPKTLQWLYETNAQKPTPSPTPRVTPKPDDGGVDEKSPASRVRPVQQKLIALGLMPEGSDDGSYGATTASAVRRFQKRVNELSGYEVLEVTGRMDAQSLAFLNYYAEEWEALRRATAKPTATPAPTRAPTPTPTTRPVETLRGVIDANSPAQTVRKVQRLLMDIGMLPKGSDDGVYGSATISAVADFQQWVNAQRKEETLAVNGEVDQMTLAYLQYCVDHGMMPYGTPTPAPTQAPTPTPAPTAEPEEYEPEQPEGSQEISVGPDSPVESIRYIQEMLSAVGAMEAGGVDGVYGRGTSAAVERFQRWVNSLQGGQTLPETGLVDNNTRLALEYAFDHELQMEQAPTEAPTQAPTQIPTQAPTAEPEPEIYEPEQPEGSQEIDIGPDSPEESIRFVQEMLNAVGLLGSGSVSGRYDEATTQAVRSFQRWVNEVQGSQVLEVTGLVDDRTRSALEYAYDRGMRAEQSIENPTEETPTEAPTQAPTEAPEPEPEEYEPEQPEGSQEIDIGPGSPEESIGFVQEMLDSVGLLNSGSINGRYDEATTQAVRDFQRWVNEVQGSQVLEVTGLVDDRTRSALEYAYDRGMRAEQSVETPTEEAPTEAPTEEPGVGEIDALDIAFGDSIAGDETIELAEGSHSVRWRAEGEVDSYYVTVEDSSGQAILSQEATGRTEFTVNTSQMVPGEVYTLRLGALPARGRQEDIVWREVRFTLPAQATPEPTPEPEPEPTVASISAPNISIADVEAGSSTILVEADSFQISWAAEGDVESYLVSITDADGNAISEPQQTTQTGVSLRAGAMQEGVVYTLTVGALPAGGDDGDMVYSRAQFMRPAQATPEPTPEPTEVPTPAPVVASIGKPVVNVGGTAYQRDGVPYMTDSSIILSWGADGDVESYTVYVENQSGERQDLGTSTDTSRTVSTQSLPAGVYTVVVGALPANGSRDDMQWGSASFGIPAPTEEPTREPEQQPASPSASGPISGSTDADTVQQLQMRLYSLGLLSTDGLEPGVLDEPTLQAVAQFQTRMNEEYGLDLPVVDPSDPTSVVDETTVRAIFGN